MRIGILQLNTTPGAIERNADAIFEGWLRCRDQDAQLVSTAELALCGYPPRDLLDRPDFHRRVDAALHDLAQRTHDGPPLLVGAPLRSRRPWGRPWVNAAVLLHHGRIEHTVEKTLLPTYDVFDEARYFEPASEHALLHVAGERIAVLLCEDLWNDHQLHERPGYALDPLERLGPLGPSLLLNLSASPWSVGKTDLRTRIATHAAARWNAPLVYINQVGGNDELLFDGRSFAVAPDGAGLGSLAPFVPETRVLDLEDVAARTPHPVRERDAEPEIVDALTLGVRDYFRRTGFQRAVLGLSGGIDSALTAAIAARALGPENVLGVTLPGPYSSPGSVSDSHELAQLLGIEIRTFSITETWRSLLDTLAPVLGDDPPDATEQNLQARCRGVLLMAISNRERRLLLTTGNKSEIAVGYCTLYGDMCGALGVIADLPKTTVYDVCRWLNTQRPTIPLGTLTKPPSAELAPDQRDDDNLPPYPVLDDILERSLVQLASRDEIVAAGHAPDTVDRVLRLVDLAEHKRRQAAPGLRVSSRAFGVGRRMPIAATFQAPAR